MRKGKCLLLHSITLFFGEVTTFFVLHVTSHCEITTFCYFSRDITTLQLWNFLFYVTIVLTNLFAVVLLQTSMQC